MIAGACVGAFAEQHRIGWLDHTMVYVVSVSLVLCVRMLVLAKRARSRGKLPFDLGHDRAGKTEEKLTASTPRPAARAGR